MAKYKDLKLAVQVLTDRIKNADKHTMAAENQVRKLQRRNTDLEHEMNQIRMAEALARERAKRLEESAKHPPASKLILINRKLQKEVNHLQRLVNTRRR
jgi:chromosome segregation ATPase